MRKLRHKRAIFMDRDGVINNVDIDYDIPKAYAPRKTEDLNIIPEAFSFISEIKKLNYLVIIVSNQPDIALNKINEKTKINLKKHFKYLLHCNNIIVDNIYYCHHHEHSINPKYSKICDCRKPKPGMILSATKKHDIDIKKSFLIGDTWRDIQAGNSAGCTTILLSKIWSGVGQCKPNFTVESLEEALDIIKLSS